MNEFAAAQSSQLCFPDPYSLLGLPQVQVCDLILGSEAKTLADILVELKCSNLFIYLFTVVLRKKTLQK